MIELGKRVKDVVTGFRGIAVARLDHLFRYPEIKVEPEQLDENGRPQEGVWFEEKRVEETK